MPFTAYIGTLNQFHSDAVDNKIADIIAEACKKNRRGFTENEKTSWKRSLSLVATQLKNSNLPMDLGIACELETGRGKTSIDLVISGYDKEEIPNIIIVELKQWSSIEFSEVGTGWVYANVGGRTDVKKGYIETNANSQSYDLQSLWADVSESGKRIDITRVFHEGTPAITRFFDPYSVSGQGTLNLVDEFGFGSFSPAAQFMLMPIFEDIQRFQHIEFNDTIRKSAHTFNIVNNKLQVFPLPTGTYKLWFEYIVKDEYDSNSTVVQDGVVSDYSNIGYDFMIYSQINDVGKQWVRKYSLALAKELLGAVREKYSTVPIPGSEVSLDGAALRAEAQTEKDQLIEQLRANLEEVSNKVRYETEAENAENQQKLMTKVPINIYIG